MQKIPRGRRSRGLSRNVRMPATNKLTAVEKNPD